jgi:hypothetical protein
MLSFLVEDRKMKALSIPMIGGLCLALLACSSAPSQHLAKPETIPANGAYTHAASGMAFPAAVADFRRVTLLRYDSETRDVSAYYFMPDPSGGVAATVYVDPTPPLVPVGSPADLPAARQVSCESEADRRKREIYNLHPSAKLLQERNVTLIQGGTPRHGKVAEFDYDDEFGGQRQALHAEVYLFCYVGSRWALEYRFTAPKTYDASGRIAAFMKTLPWTIPAGS